MSCDIVNWWVSFDKKGWFVCLNDCIFFKGFWWNDLGGNNGFWFIEEGKCCGVKELSYVN